MAEGLAAPLGAVQHNHPLHIQRPEIIEEIIDTIRNDQSVLLTGPYMGGKTSILLDVYHKLRSSEGMKVVFVDLAADSLEEWPGALGSIFREIVAEILDTAPSGLNGPLDTPIDSPSDFGRAVLRLAKDLGHPLVVIFDELHRLSDQMADFVLMLRWITERAKRPPYEETRISFIVAGVVDVDELVDGHNSPFNTAHYILLDDLSKSEVEEYLLRPGVISEEGGTLPEPVVDFIFAETGGSPYLIQQFTACMRQKRDTLEWTEAELKEVADRVAKQHSFDFDLVKEKLATRAAVQELVERLLNREPIPYSIWNIEVRHARLIGIIQEDKETGNCRIRGEIYGRILRSQSWDELLP